MKINESRFDADARLENGRFEEYFKDGSLASTGAYKDGEKTGEWKYYLLNGQLKVRERSRATG